MIAQKCDRCGAFYDFYRGMKVNSEAGNGIVFIDRDTDTTYWTRNSKDLCPACMSKLLLWFNNNGDDPQT